VRERDPGGNGDGLDDPLLDPAMAVHGDLRELGVWRAEGATIAPAQQTFAGLSQPGAATTASDPSGGEPPAAGRAWLAVH
jgi:hypothetical protein